MNARFEKPESTYEIIHEICETNAEIFKNGHWRKADYKDAIEKLSRHPVTFHRLTGVDVVFL
ncbi:hypothetical protein QUF90_18990 [Desulfococcaceae bacterium HSG9]|nr:hypothetical protein [Desulfococcaceae bacterium HSG9]